MAREERTAATSRAEGAVLARAGERLEGTLLLDFPDGDGELVIPLPKVPG